MMRKLFILLFLAVWSAQIFADDTVRLHPDTDLVVNGTTNISFPLNVVESSAGATPTESAPAEIFVPMNGSSGQADYFTVKGVTTLFGAVGSESINFPLYLNVGATRKYLYVAIKGTTGNYKIAQRQSDSYLSQTNLDVTFPVTSQAICTQATDCSEFASTSSTEKAYFAYFFLSDQPALSVGDDLATPGTTYPGGIYFKINMSNRVYTVSQVRPVITEVRPGDGRLIVKYTSASSILKPKAVRILLRKENPTEPIEMPIETYYSNEPEAVLYVTEFAYSNEGEITVNNLKNSEEQFLSVLFEDQYKFGTVVSESAMGRPEEIQQLLEKNACFLLTAGFGEDHYVIDYFRHFRDTVLASSYLGRSFIHVYYELAPKYALIMYQHEGIRAIIRGFAYTLYFIFNFYYLFVAAFIGAGAFLVYRKREKVRQTL
jgi:hypothetical protein